MLIGLLSLVVMIVSLVCWIMVLIQMFKTSVLQGILGIICGLWALIWGFMNMKEKGLEKVMMVWAACIVVNLVLNFAFGGMGGMGDLSP